MGLIACKVSEGGGVTKGWWTLVMGKEREKSSSPLAVERSQPGRKNKYAMRVGRPNFISSGEML
jgi:hypothetical protein